MQHSNKTFYEKKKKESEDESNSKILSLSEKLQESEARYNLLIEAYNNLKTQSNNYLENNVNLSKECTNSRVLSIQDIITSLKIELHNQAQEKDYFMNQVSSIHESYSDQKHLQEIENLRNDLKNLIEANNNLHEKLSAKDKEIRKIKKDYKYDEVTERIKIVEEFIDNIRNK
jgi:hypothetical protein